MASTVSVRDDIINNIKTTLQTITIANGYNQDVALVSTENFMLPEQLTVEEVPALYIIDDDEDKSAADGDVDSLWCTLNITIEGILKKINDADPVQERRRKLQSDVEKALMVDETRGQYAEFTKVKRITTDKALLEPDFTMFNLEFSVEYFHNRNDPADQDNNP